MSYIYKGGDLPPETKIAHNIMKDVAFLLNKRYNMHSLGGSERGSEGEYRKLGLSFEISYPITKIEGRKIIVDCVTEFLKAINNNKDFQHYMSNYPFTSKNIELSIFIIKEDINEISEDELQVISLEEGKINYKYAKLNSVGYISIERENFDSAEKLIF